MSENTEATWAQFKLVGLGGGAGGVLVVLFNWATEGNFAVARLTSTAGVEPSFLSSLWSGSAVLALSAVFGVFASLIGVYVISNTDLDNMPRAVGFAILCGFCWQPVLVAGRTYMEHALQQQQVDAKIDAAEQAIVALDEASPTDVPILLHTVERTTSAALTATQQSDVSAARSDAAALARRSVDAIVQQREVAPDAAATALASLGSTAAFVDLPDVATVAVQKIPTESVGLAASAQTYDTLRNIPRVADDPALSALSTSKGAELVVAAAEKEADQSPEKLRDVPLGAARRDLESAVDYYRKTGVQQQADRATTSLEKAEELEDKKKGTLTRRRPPR